MNTMTNEIAIVKPDQLDEVITKSGLAIQEGEGIKKSYLPFLVQLAETQSQAQKINFESPSEIDETIARELRLKTVKIRTGAEALKDTRKKEYLLKGNLEQAAYNLIAASCKLTEETFFNVEKARELALKKRQQELRREREEKLSPYTENVVIYPLGLMSEDEFSVLYVSLRTAHENRLEAEKKAEEARIAKEKADAEERERQRLENIRLKEEVIIERKKQADILAKQKAEADKREKELKDKADAERKERERLADELRAKKDAEEKSRKDAEAKAVADKKAQVAAEKKARLAPDKDKLISLAKIIKSIQMPEVKSLEAQGVTADVQSLLNKVVNFIQDKAEKL